MYTILGAGLSGLSVADHLKRKNIPCTIFESKTHGGGHIYSRNVDGFTWDEGPHVSFTKHEYVKEYFAENCVQNFLEYPVKPTNYYKSNWIPHPAQSHMYAIPEPIRSECINDIILARERNFEGFIPSNYNEWLQFAFGKKFTEIFSEAYTNKYWTTESEKLTTDWIGKRIYFPEINDMVNSAKGPLDKQTHYINKVRYPQRGGYYSYIKAVEQKLDVLYNKKLTYISFSNKELTFSDGQKVIYDKLISTLPLPELLINSDAPNNIKACAKKLRCSQLLIVNVVVNHSAPINNHWIYVYDDDFYSTRINFTELLAPENGIEGKSGIQVEVYFSDYRKLNEPIKDIAQKVLQELITMKLIENKSAISSYHTQWLEWANVIFDENRVKAQDAVFTWLSANGLVRENDDLEPMTDWDTKQDVSLGDIILAGRFAQWKYYWTDDCVMRGKYIAESI